MRVGVSLLLEALRGDGGGITHYQLLYPICGVRPRPLLSAAATDTPRASAARQILGILPEGFREAPAKISFFSLWPFCS